MRYCGLIGLVFIFKLKWIIKLSKNLKNLNYRNLDFNNKKECLKTQHKSECLIKHAQKDYSKKFRHKLCLLVTLRYLHIACGRQVEAGGVIHILGCVSET